LHFLDVVPVEDLVQVRHRRWEVLERRPANAIGLLAAPIEVSLSGALVGPAVDLLFRERGPHRCSWRTHWRCRSLGCSEFLLEFMFIRSQLCNTLILPERLRRGPLGGLTRGGRRSPTRTSRTSVATRRRVNG